MDPHARIPNDHPVRRLIEADEQVEVVAGAVGADLLVTDRRIAVASDHRVALDITFKALRRIQFDIERTRPATLVIVPESPADEPQVLAVPPERYDEIARALVIIGQRLAEAS